MNTENLVKVSYRFILPPCEVLHPFHGAYTVFSSFIPGGRNDRAITPHPFFVVTRWLIFGLKSGHLLCFLFLLAIFADR